MTTTTNTSKPTKARKAAPSKAPIGVQAKPKAKPVTGPTISVVGQPAKGYRVNSARAVWWSTLQQYDKQPLTAFTTAVTANPPTLPTKGKGEGKPEPVMGWITYFVRQGLITLS